MVPRDMEADMRALWRPIITSLDKRNTTSLFSLSDRSFQSCCVSVRKRFIPTADLKQACMESHRLRWLSINTTHVPTFKQRQPSFPEENTVLFPHFYATCQAEQYMTVTLEFPNVFLAMLCPALVLMLTYCAKQPKDGAHNQQ